MDNNLYWLRRAIAEQVSPLASEWAPVLWSAERSCCCSAKPAVVVLVTLPDDPAHPVDLLLCRYHHERSRAALAGSVVYDAGDAARCPPQPQR
ncbi:hypothetical protein ABZ816_02160 [Actinosynnema sp. NPDC047251]|uniref:Uncharacterized protein n=1 Tax=Saccharothrix espanaensis (strain ATCC 51144 / DSM 44229 / JCM 9112 / NBRC 15066 / NRRL 15764) TaxID=1179773 RepID=K0K2H5_SACES|nr:hypothetical protein [Saccharothrix espanaensis]CCH31054.1 hypothetical protein BN6_37630 [Saccharothrix espanaensis DSM 44229]